MITSRRRIWNGLSVAGLLAAASVYLVGCAASTPGGGNSTSGSVPRGDVAPAVTLQSPSITPRASVQIPLNPASTTAAYQIPAKVVPVADQSAQLASAGAGNAPSGATGAQDVDPLDWPYWRGPGYNGISHETGLVDDWNPRGGKGSNVLWKRDDLGTRSTPIVMHGRLYTICRAEPDTAGEGERVVCVDAATGESIWENRFNVYLSDVPAERVGWSSVVGDPATGRVYALGVCGTFQCLDGETGESLWSYPLHEEFGMLSTFGGRTNFPIISDDLVIISAIVIGWGDMAKPSHAFIAFDKISGQVVWFKGTRPLPYDTTYSGPTVTVLAGRKALVFGSGDGAVWALQPRTGQPIWQYKFSRRGLNVAPVVVGDKIFAGHSEENVTGTAMGALAAIDGSQSGDVTQKGELWRVEELMVGKSSPIVVDGRLYAVDDRAKLHVLDTATGEALVRRKPLGTAMRSSLLYADEKIYATTLNGRWYIMKPDERRGVMILSKGRLRGAACHGSPICSHGRVYIPTTGALYCLQDESKQHGSVPRPRPAEEKPAEEDGQPVHVQVTPAEVLLRPGQTLSFTTRLFNSRGQRLESAAAEFSLQGLGAISADGTFTAPDEADQTAVEVRATVGNLVGTARVRVVPPLPWHFNFEDIAIDSATGKGEPPITWIGVRHRHVVRQIDGNKVMVKVTTIPKGTRSRGWMGHADMHDYTIQADVHGALKNDQMPDIGLIAQGYTLDLQGESQSLEIRTWVTQRRMARSVGFPWKPNTWYTMKLRAAVEDGKAVLRGKVWPKGQDEPQDWSIEAVDEQPNLTGSPGLFGSANVAEIHLDNIHVQAN